MTDETPNPSKLALIRRFLILSGTQERIDSGSFLHRLGAPGGPLFGLQRGQVTLLEALAGPIDVVIAAYEKHRPVWQVEYESHVDHEFNEEVLASIVGFLESSAGGRFLEACWRMDAYVETNTEHLLEEIVDEARAALGGGADASAE